MIVDKMTKAELLKELREDYDYFNGRNNGWITKYSKKLRDKRIPNHKVLAITPYTTPNGNKVKVFIFKEKVGKVNILSRTFLFEVGLRCLIPNFDSVGKPLNVVIFTKHFQDRLLERTGKTLIESLIMLRESGAGGVCIKPYESYKEQGLEEGEWYVANMNNTLCLATTHKWGFILTTVITKRQESKSQKIEYLICKSESNEHDKELREEDEKQVLLDKQRYGRNYYYPRS